MTKRYAEETTGVYDGTLPSTRTPGDVVGANVRRMRAKIDLSLATFANGDTVSLGKLPQGARFAYGMLTASATMGASATIAIGVSGTAAKYRAAAVHTTVDQPVLFGKAAVVGSAALTAEEEILLTIAVADLPASGTLVVDIYYTLAG